MNEQLAFVNKVINAIQAETNTDIDELALANDEQLLSVMDKTNTAQAVNQNVKTIRPVTSIAQSSLLLVLCTNRKCLAS